MLVVFESRERIGKQFSLFDIIYQQVSGVQRFKRMDLDERRRYRVSKEGSNVILKAAIKTAEKRSIFEGCELLLDKPKK